MEVRLSTTVAETTVRVPTAGQTGFIQPTNENNPQMKNKKNKADTSSTSRVFPNRYGRKPSKLVSGPNSDAPNRTLGIFPSRRAARRERDNAAKLNNLKTFQTRIVPNGEQEND